MQATVAPTGPSDAIGPTNIMRHVYGVFPSLAMLAAMKLDLFTPLKDGPLSAEDLARSLGVGEEKLYPLLYSLVAAGLLEMKVNLFANTAETAKYLVRGLPNYMGDLSGFYQNLWQAALQTAKSIETSQPQAKLDWSAWPEEELYAYFRRQLPSSINAGRELAQKLDFSRCAHLLDAGGGTGGVAMAICNRFGSLKATVADLPRVVPLAERFVAESGMSGRIGLAAADLCKSPPEGKYDVAVCRAVLQTLAKEQARLVVGNIGRSLAAGGRLYIVGNVLHDTRLSPPAALAFGLVFLNVYDDGGAYTETEYTEWLDGAGFSVLSVEPAALGDGSGIITAEKR